MNQNVLSNLELKDFYDVRLNLEDITKKYYGLPDTASTRAMLEADIEAARRDYDRHSSKVMYITKENIDGEELLILSEEVMTMVGSQEEFTSLNDVIKFVVEKPEYNSISILLRYDVEDVKEEELQSAVYHSKWWELSEDEMYYELLIYPK